MCVCVFYSLVSSIIVFLTGWHLKSWGCFQLSHRKVKFSEAEYLSNTWSCNKITKYKCRLLTCMQTFKLPNFRDRNKSACTSCCLLYRWWSNSVSLSLSHTHTHTHTHTHIRTHTHKPTAAAPLPPLPPPPSPSSSLVPCTNLSGWFHFFVL